MSPVSYAAIGLALAIVSAVAGYGLVGHMFKGMLREVYGEIHPRRRRR